MQNIIAYFNTFLNVIFGSRVVLLSPADCFNNITSSVEAATSFEGFLLNILDKPVYWLSYFVWTWLVVLTVNLLLIFPYKWIRSVIRKCKL